MDDVKYTKGGRGEFYGGDQVYTTGFKKRVVPFTGDYNKLNDSFDKQKNCCNTIFKIIKYFC